MNIRKTGTLILVILFTSIQMYAQSEQVSLQQIITDLEEKYGLEFSYDPDLASRFIFDSNEFTEGSAEEILSLLSSKVPLDFEQVEGNFILVKTRPYTIDITVQDATEDSSIPGVYIKKNGQLLQLVSDVDGTIKTTLEWKASDIISLEFLGYEKLEIPIVELIQKNSKIIKLSQGTTILNELIITSYLGDGISANQKNHSLAVKTSDLGMLPGDLDKDLLVSLKTLPGIHTVTGRSGELRVRGGTPDQTLILFNNIPIYHQGYYYGTISPFSTDIIDKVTVHRSGFAPRLGGRVGGAVEIESNSKVPEEFKLGLASNTYMASSYMKVPVVKDKLGMVFSFRGSHPGDYRSPKEGKFDDLVISATDIGIRDEREDQVLEPVSYDFWDLNGTIVIEPSENDQLKFHILSINNVNTISILDNDTSNNISQNLQQTDLSNFGISANWNKSFGAWQSSLFFTTSNYVYQLDNDEFDNRGRPASMQNVRNDISNSKFGASLTRQSEKSEFSFGYEYTNIVAEFSDVIMRPRQPPARIIPGGAEVDINSVFVDFAYYGIPRLALNTGVRANSVAQLEDFRLEPRIFLNYSITDQLTFKSSYGLYSQFLSKTLFFDFSDLSIEKLTWGIISPNGPRLASWQALAGFSYQTPNFLFDADGYYKDVNGLFTNGPSEELPMGGLSQTTLYGSLNVRGLDFLAKYRFDNFDIWTNYTLSRAYMMFPDLKTEEFPANYDQTHNISIAGAFKWNNFRGSIGWSASSGLPNYFDDPFFPVVGPYTAELPEPTPVGELERFDWVHQLDASLNYEYFPGKGKTKVTLGASVLNLYNQENLLETINVRLAGGTEDGVPRTLPADRFTIGFAPDLMIKVEF